MTAVIEILIRIKFVYMCLPRNSRLIVGVAFSRMHLNETIMAAPHWTTGNPEAFLVHSFWNRLSDKHIRITTAH